MSRRTIRRGDLEEPEEFCVAVWQRGEFVAIESEHAEHHDAEARAARLHGEVNEGQFRPVALFVPLNTERLQREHGPLDRTDEYAGVSSRRRSIRR